ncbi:MFS transporter [Nocardia sp. BMG111209]|uniref:MFS transporter n=1 Tax=Nocardia sp. BMG111209 TaxID=1160137 RepID=UPI0003815DA4
MVSAAAERVSDRVAREHTLSTWAPFSSPVYRALWIAQLVSNLGTWMQTVGAQWLLVDKPHAAVLVSLVQAATTLPVMLLVVPSGVLADLLDRRRLLLVAQTAMAALAVVLTVVTAVGHTTPTVLLSLLFLLGCGQALVSPSWQAIQPELVPRTQIPAAASLSSMNINSARAIGPALAGVLVSLAGPTVVFGLNAVSFAGIVAVLFRWRQPVVDRDLPPERWLPALRAGLRFIRSSPSIRRVLLRSILFIFPASAVWSLLAVVAHDRLGLGSDGYGVLLSALGAGAVLGATQIGRLRRALSTTGLLALSGVLFGIGALAAAVVPYPPLVWPGLLFAGLAWMVSMSTMNSSMQLLLPGWVRARGLSMFQLVLMGGQAVGALVWGVIAGVFGIVPTLLVSAAMLGLCALSTRWLPVRVTSLDTRHAEFWPEPAMVVEPEPRDGPVLVLRTYGVPADQLADFTAAMARVGRSRQRTGASRWQLYRDIGATDRYIEAFVVRSWEEHMHQHHVRLTAQDEAAEKRVEQYTVGETRTMHLVAEPVDDVRPPRRGPAVFRARHARSGTRG